MAKGEINARIRVPMTKATERFLRVRIVKVCGLAFNFQQMTLSTVNCDL